MKNAESKKFTVKTIMMTCIIVILAIGILLWDAWDYSQHGERVRFMVPRLRCYLSALQNTVTDCLEKNGWAEKEAVEGCLASAYECAQVETVYSMAPEDRGIVSIRIARYEGTLVIRFRPGLVANVEAKEFTVLDWIKDSM
jgi:hypothetical protein